MKMEPNNESSTRDTILAVAARFFAAQGYDGTSIREIVEEAGVTKPALYYYFKNKEDLYKSVIQDAYDYFFGFLIPIVEDDLEFIAKLEKITALYFSLTQEGADMVRMIYDALFFPKRNPFAHEMIWENEQKHLNFLKTVFADGIRKGYIRKGDIDDIVHHYIGTVNLYIMLILAEQKTLPAEVEKRVIHFVLHGIGTGKS